MVKVKNFTQDWQCFGSKFQRNRACIRQQYIALNRRPHQLLQNLGIYSPLMTFEQVWVLHAVTHGSVSMKLCQRINSL